MRLPVAAMILAVLPCHAQQMQRVGHMGIGSLVVLTVGPGATGRERAA
jgi:hypothetical protein